MTSPNTAPPALRAMLEAERADNLRWNGPSLAASSHGGKAVTGCLLVLGLAAVLIGAS